MNKAIALMSCISTLLLSGFSHVSALSTPTRIGYSISDPFYENLDIEYYANSYTTDSETFSVTFDGSPTFTVDDLLINGATTYYNSTGNVILDSNLTLNNQSFNVDGTIDLSDLSVELESDGNGGGHIQNYYNYTYTKVQRIVISFSAPAQGYIKMTPLTSGVTESGWSYRAVDGCSVIMQQADTSTNTLTIRPSGNTVAVIEIYKHYNRASSITTNRFFGVSNASFDDGSHLEAYEVPVSDDSTHTALTESNSRLGVIQGWLSSIHQLLDQMQSGVQDINDDLADTADDLADLGDSMHSTETDIFDDMDTALSSPSLNLNISNIIGSSTKPKAAFTWIANQMQYIVMDLGTGISNYWTYIFIFPLILGIAFIIIGRLR